MRAEITDNAALRSLRPLDIASYLHATGWADVEEIGEKATLWRSLANSDAEVVVPTRNSFADFGMRVSDILQTLQKVERRSQLEIFSDVISVWSDLVRLRAADADLDQGTLSINSGVDFLAGAHDVMLSVACSTVIKKGNFARRKPTQANDYMQRVRLGQTERGSFVLTLHCPVTPMLRPEANRTVFPEEPFERQVTNTLMTALEAVRSAAREATTKGDFAPFRQAVAAGVSANLCSAIVRLGSVVPKSGVEIGVTWSRTRGPVGNVPTSVMIRPDSFPVIEEAARIFRETEPLEDFIVVGFIGQLTRPESDPTGRVAITGLVENEARRIVVDLPEQQYAIAVDAHNRRKTIALAGELIKEGRSYKLQHPRDLRIIEDENAETTARIEF